MPAPDERRCKLNALPGACCDAHIREHLERIPGKKTTFRCPLNPEHTTFGVKAGNLGQRIVWGCIEGGPTRGDGTCTRGLLRQALADLGIDAACLGNYGRWDADFTAPAGSPAWSAQRVVDNTIITKAQKYDAITELPSAITGKLRDMCIQAIIEREAGRVTADPWELLPGEKVPFHALADRTGILGTYKYKLFDQWTALTEGAA